MTDSSATSSDAMRQALVAIDRLQSRVDQLEGAATEPMAICGVGCRFPRDADSVEAFWQQLVDGVDSVSEIPADRWDVDSYFDSDPDAPGKMYTRSAATLRGIDQFDAPFFGITPREAASLDPQQRLLLECTWEALENAQISSDSLAERPVGVYVGIINDDYGDLQLADGGASEIDAYFGSGNSSSVAAGRLSYVLGLSGPAISVDTACSSSLVAVHLAAQALRTGEVEMAIAGGVNVTLLADSTVALSRYKMMAPDGRCKTFDAAADGYVRGEGCGVIVLKRLSDAIAAGDPIDGVIHATALNQDGASSGLTAPNGPAQQAVVRQALTRAGRSARDVAYVEAHGTGTSLGDPIELQALDAVLGPDRDSPLLVGSVKTNIGHLESAAGMAGLIKAMLVSRHRYVPPHLHLSEPNPLIPWDRLRLKVPTDGLALPDEAGDLAGVSSFGFSGTNAHILVGPPPPMETSSAPEREAPHVLVLSGATDTALVNARERHLETLGSATSLAAYARASGRGRSHQNYRAAIVASDVADARQQLQDWTDGDQGNVVVGRVLPQDRRVAMLFTGQGSQYPGMGLAFATHDSYFSSLFDSALAAFDGQLPLSLREVVAGDHGSDVLDRTLYTQPALFALEHALATYWLGAGVEPVALLGHSIGEYVAAAVGGVMSLADGAALIAARARGMDALPDGGAMAVVRTDVDTTREAIGSLPVEIAARNNATNTVLSGPEADVATVCGRLTDRDIDARPLRVSHAFHSHLMEPMLAEFEATVRSIGLHSPTRRIVTNRDGSVAGAGIAEPSHWVNHVRDTVDFAAGVETLTSLACNIFVEAGPSPSLSAMAAFGITDPLAVWVPSLRPGSPEAEVVARTFARLHVAGVDLDWSIVHGEQQATDPRPPTYPFQRTRHWFAARKPTGPDRGGKAIVHPLLGGRLDSPLGTVFEQVLHRDSFPFLADHQVNGVSLLPAAAYVEMMRAAANELLMPSATIADLVIAQPMVFGDDPLTVELVGEPSGDGWQMAVHARASSSDSWTRHATAMVAARPAAERDDVAAVSDLPTSHDVDDHYSGLLDRGFTFGTAMQTVTSIRSGEAQAEASVAGVVTPGFGVEPTVLDGCLQFLWSVLPDADAASTFFPVRFGSISVSDRGWDSVVSHAVRRTIATDSDGGTEHFSVDVTVRDSAGTVIGEITDLEFRRTSADLIRRLGQPAADTWLYESGWSEADPVARTRTTVVAFPDDEDATAWIEDRHAQLVAHHGLAGQADAVASLAQISARFVALGLRELGCDLSPDRVVSADTLAAELGVIEKYRRELRRLLDLLAEQGFAHAVGDGSYRFAASVDLGDPVAELGALRVAHPEALAQIDVTERCGVKLAGVLSGRVDPLGLIFPGGDTSLAEGLYRDTPEAKVYNGLISESVTRLIESLPADEPIRIAELGAGTGGATSFVVPSLPADRIQEYRFTDLSSVFLDRAKEAFADYSFMDYSICDVQHDPGTQGLDVGGYDIVIAFNMIHATPDLKKSVQNATRLLRPGGALVLMEGTEPEGWIDVTFGLTDGWWAFDDRELRPSYPLLDRETWRSFLDDCGLEAVVTAPAKHPLSAQVIITARRPLDSAPGEHVLVVGDDEITAAVTDALLTRGRSVTQVEPVQAAATLRSDESIREVVVPVGGSGEDGELATQQGWIDPLLSIVRAAANVTNVPQLTIATVGAWAIAEPDTIPALATLWGLAKVIDLEHPELRCRRIDLDPAASTTANASGLAAELDAADDERLVALRGAARLVGRLERATLPDPYASTCERLVHDGSGVLDNLAFAAARRRDPGAGEVEIEVSATGVSFRDVLIALAVRDDPDPVGAECTGKIVAIGGDVVGLEIGDRVIALTTGGFDSHVVVDARLVAAIDSRLSDIDAATLPTAFTTAMHCLNGLANLRKGQSVLIHAATGGVGLAAVQLATAAGADIHATAGSPAKRAYLRRLGVAGIYDSRTTEFAAEVLAATGGRGVDVVLNSLAGEFIGASVAALAEDGVFCEIGKRDIWNHDTFAESRPGARYEIVDLAADADRDPAHLAGLLRAVAAGAASGTIRPLPVTEYSATNVADAFRLMSQARHLGKIVVDRRAERSLPVRSDVTYLVTGGLNGVGLKTAGWLVERGARHLVLASRRGSSDEAGDVLDDLRAAGATVQAAAVDVADRKALARLVADIDESEHPLGGVIHSAGVLADATMANLKWEHFVPVFAAKVAGAANLDSVLGNRPLDFLVLYSSTSALLGAAGQANHAAANAYLDALAWSRRSRGLAGQSINWGVWSDIGSAAAKGADARIISLGAYPMSPDQGLDILDSVMRSGVTQVAVVPVRWPKFLDKFVGPAHHPWWSTMDVPSQPSAPVIVDASPTASSIVATSAVDEIREAPIDERPTLLAAAIARVVERVVGLAANASMDHHQPLSEMGLDSLMAVELRNLLTSIFEPVPPLPATLVFDHPTVAALTDRLLATVSPASPEPHDIDGSTPIVGTPSSVEDILRSIESMTAADVDQALEHDSE